MVNNLKQETDGYIRQVVILNDICDFDGTPIFKKGEELTIFKSFDRDDIPAWEVMNHPYRNGFIFRVSNIDKDALSMGLRLID